MTQQFHNGISVSPLLSVSRTTDNTQLGLNQSHLGYSITCSAFPAGAVGTSSARRRPRVVSKSRPASSISTRPSPIFPSTPPSPTGRPYRRAARPMSTARPKRAAVSCSTPCGRSSPAIRSRAASQCCPGNLADRTASRIAAEQQLLQAKQQLAAAVAKVERGKYGRR